MSDETPNPLRTTSAGSVIIDRPEVVPDSQWREMRDDEQDPETPETPDNRPHSIHEDSRSPSLVPVSLRILAATAGNIANSDAAISSDDVYVSINDLAQQAGAVTEFMADSTGTIALGHEQGAAEPEEELADSSGPPFRFGDRSEEQGDTVHQDVERMTDTIRIAGSERPNPLRLSRDFDDLSDEAINAYLQRNRDAVIQPSFMERQEEVRARARQIREARENLAIDNDEAVANTPPPADGTNNGQNRSSDTVSGRPSSARRDLERALRDYRIARRALRSHNANEPSSLIEQNSPTYSGIMAQLGEQNNNYRNRMRARGQSRSSILDRTDAIVDRIAGAAGVGRDAWRSDDDNDTVIAPITPRLINQNEPHVDPESPGWQPTGASSLPGIAATSNPYLGPTTSARGNLGAGTSGGMRDFYRRIEDRERIATRTGTVDARNLPLHGLDSQRNQLTHFLDMRSRTRDGKAPNNTTKSRAKNVMKYLSKLKKFDNDGERSLALAKDLGIDSLAESLVRETEVDLPLHIRELPKPQYSSWLVPGMSWKGVQKGGYGKPDSEFSTLMNAIASGPLFDDNSVSAEDRILQLRALRHRERVRAERQTQEQEHLGGQSTLSQVRDESRGMLSGVNNRIERMETLADVEEHLSLLLQEEERRLNQGTDRGWRVTSVGFQTRSGPPPTAEKKENEDKWPVEVTVHEVDWDKMTLSGTMIASQIPVRRPSVVMRGEDASNIATEADNSVSSMGMETFFDGEIIDFHTHELETVSDKAGYKIGGINTDLKYWSRIGPFKEEIKKKVQVIKEKKAVEYYERLGISGTLDEQRAEYRRTFKDESINPEEMDKEEVAGIVYNAMADFLSSRKWIDKAIGEGGWVFMRWKERCFIDPPTSDSTSNNAMEHSRARTLLHRPTVYTTDYTDANHPEQISASGLTIRGFYYVAMNRMSGKIEALYYDSGSQPFQELLIQPIGYGSFDDSKSDSGSNDLGQIGFKYDVGVYEFR